MFRILEAGNSLPFQWPSDPAATFQSGSAMMLAVSGSTIVATPSNGMAFIGVADDVKTRAYYANSIDEEILVAVAPSDMTLNGSNQLVTNRDIKAELENPNVDSNSFVSANLPVQLIPRNGVIIFPAGTPLNIDILNTGTPNALKTLVRYRYQIPNIIGDDTTFASQQVTVWFQRMIFESDQFEVNQQYQVNSNLFINETGLFTTRQINPNSPAVAICLAPPSGLHGGSLQALLL